MDNNIPVTVREASAPQDIARHWREMDRMMTRDIRPNCDLGAPMTDEEAARFLAGAYHDRIDALCRREVNPCRRVFFTLDGGREIGFALYCTYLSEDGKCFIVNFCVYPEHRNRGLGRRCFAALADYAGAHGARYFELNTHCRRAMRFWESVGFRCNGCDEEGTILLCRPPEETVPFTAVRLTDPGDPDLGWQLRRLENGFLSEIGEEAMDDERWVRLSRAIREERIAFFLARRGFRAVGMCSAAPCFSSFACRDNGVFDDFFVEPVFRRQGAAKLLAESAMAWARERGLASLTVGCSPEDVDMYRSLGFRVPLGTMLSALIPGPHHNT